ncbi:hypothetical protein PG995_013188 [Apiospora arundinis]
MDPARLKNVKNDKVVPYLNELREQGHSISQLGEELMRHVRSGFLSPHLFRIVLPWSRSPELLVRCLKGEEAAGSRALRSIAIKALGIMLSDPTLWSQVWASLGDTSGLVDLFARSSVEDVKALAGAIAHGSRKMNKPVVQAAAVDNLLRALVPTHYRSEFPSQDQRPIQHHYARMVRAASLEFLDELVQSKDTSNPLSKGCNPERLARRHGDWMQQQVVDMLSGRIKDNSNLHEFFKICISRNSGEPTKDPLMTSSMTFCMRILRARLDGTFQDKCWEKARMDELEVLQIVYGRMAKRSWSSNEKRARPAKEKLHGFAIFAFELAEAKPTLRTSHNMGSMWGTVFSMWKSDPTPRLEELVTKGLRWGTCGSLKSIGQDCYRGMTSPKSELNWKILRLYCLHVPEKGIDMDTAQDLTVFAKQQWPYELFETLLPTVPDKVLKLLKGLLDANPDYSFLSPPIKTHTTGSCNEVSILSIIDLEKQKNFNVDLLLTMLQRDDAEVQKTAAATVDKLRKSSATARDQNNRAQLAKGAAALAIATGNLSLYADTIEWQQRFVRDPLTVKVVFANDIIGTKEGIELLSGITKDLLTGCTLDTLVQRMDAADKILLTLRDSFKTAKAEPSFAEWDWRSVQGLFDLVFMHRYSALKTVPERLGIPEAEVFAVVWDRTMKMVEALGADFLAHIRNSIEYYVHGLPPNSLAFAAKTLLESDIKRRELKDRKQEDRVLESLSYEALLELAKSDNPKLAHELILQTILERPDASSWHRQFLSGGYLRRLSAQDAQDVLFGLARGIGEKLEEQSFVKVGEAEPAKHAPPKSLVKVTTVKHLAQLLDHADFISLEAAVEVLAELFKVATHRDIRIATLQSLCNVLLELTPGPDGTWLGNPLVVKVLDALETVVSAASSINGRSPTDWEAVSESLELPEVTQDNAALLTEVLMRSWDVKKGDELVTAYAERVVWPLWEESTAEHRRWVKLFLRKHNATVEVDELPDIPTYPNEWNVPLQRYWKRMPFAALETYHKYTVWTFNRPEPLRQFIKSLQANTKLRKQPDVVHFLEIYDSNGHYAHTAIVKILESAGLAEAQLRRLTDMVTEQCAAMLEDYESNMDRWRDAMNLHRPPVMANETAELSKAVKSALDVWNGKGRVVLERMVAMVADKKEAARKQGKQSPFLPSTRTMRLMLLPFPGVSKDRDVDEVCREYAASLRQTLQSLLEGNHLQWHQIATEFKDISTSIIPHDTRLRVAVHLGQLEASNATTAGHISAFNLLLFTVTVHLIGDGKKLVVPNANKDESSKRRAAEMGILARGLLGLMDTWRQSEDEVVRDAVLEWSRKEKGVVATIAKEAGDGLVVSIR